MKNTEENLNKGIFLRAEKKGPELELEMGGSYHELVYMVCEVILSISRKTQIPPEEVVDFVVYGVGAVNLKNEEDGLNG